MKIVSYEELKDCYCQPWSGRLFELEQMVLEGLARYYLMDKDRVYASMALSRQLPYMLYSLQGEVQGKNILDLGCGSNDRSLEGNPYIKCDAMFEPWFCRGLEFLGAHAIGIDYRGLAGEDFVYYHRNLADADCLAMLADNSVDVANASMFFDSPFFKSKLGLDPVVVKQNLISQLKRVVKPDGMFVYSQ